VSSSFESRLRDALGDAAGSVEAAPAGVPAVEPVLDAAARLRRRRVASTATVSLALAAVLISSAAIAADRLTGDAGARRVSAQLAVDSVPTTTTTVRPRAHPRSSPTTQAAPSLTPSTTRTTTTAPSTTTTTVATSRPLRERVPAGVWVVGLDGSGLRRVADAGRVAWSPDGTSLAVARDEGGFDVVAATDGRLLSSVVSGGDVSCLAWSSLGTIAWSDDRDIVRYRGADGVVRVVGELAGSPEADGLDDTCGWSPQGDVFASGGDELRFWSATGAPVEAGPAADGGSDGEGAAAGAGPYGQLAWSVNGHLAALGPDGVTVLSGGDLGTVTRVPSSSDALRVAWSPDGSKLYLREPLRLASFSPATGTSSAASPAACCPSGLTAMRGGGFLSLGVVGEALRALADPAAGTDSSPLLLADVGSGAGRCDGARFAAVRPSPSLSRSEVAVVAMPQAVSSAGGCGGVRPS
jgi:hypothetical protein